MNEAGVLEAIQDGVKVAVLTSSHPALPIKFTDITFEVPDDQKYLEIVHISNNPDSLTWGDEVLLRGFFRLILHWPKDGSGPYEPMNLIDEISAHFRKDLWLDGVKVTDVPVPAGSLDAGAELLYPASVRYIHSSH